VREPLSPLSSSANNNSNNNISNNKASPSHDMWQRPTGLRAGTTGPVDLDRSLDHLESSPSPDENSRKQLAHTLRRPDDEYDDGIPRRKPSSSEQQHQQQSQNHRPVYSMADDTNIRFSAGEMHNDDTSASDAESSSFNLSTDAEDTDYENLKRGVLPPMDTSTTLSQISSPTYNTDGEGTVFPNLHTDDDNTTQTGRDSDAVPTNLGGGQQPYRGVSHHRNISNNQNILSLSKQSTSNDSSSVENGFRHRDSAFTNGASNISGTAMNGAAARNFTSPKNKPAFKDDGFDDFANFADFNNISFPSDPAWNPAPENANNDSNSHNNNATGLTSVTSAAFSAAKRMFLGADSTGPETGGSGNDGSSGDIHSSDVKSSPSYHQRSPSGNRITTVASSGQGPVPTHTDTSLSELLAQAKSKSSSRRRSNNSINSAPALTSSYLRQHHNLKSRNGGDNRYDSGSTRQPEGTSVTDIIESLEAANASRSSSSKNQHGGAVSLNNSMNSGGRQHHRSHSRGDDTLSLHSRDTPSVRSAKERLRRRREQREAGRNRHNSTLSDSSDSDENDASESWLIDEVTGALGPRGIAPDLESLSGRSNRSRSSGGGRSHKSHKSHRSQRSSRRRRPKSSSGDSVSSHGSRRSRGSRHSRGSRYSHRSTRSYISQMSEQSRSVANDLLRLEMQLAMVGSSNDDGMKGSSASVGGGSRHSHRTGRSSSSRRSSGGARRTRMTVLAPPGKLGIILANKADSKGTVVSGVRTSSVMSEKISPGDRIVAIDGEDVSLMTVSEITTIMARKSEFERTLSILTMPKHLDGEDYRFRN